ncbi:MAG: DUF4097 family beta strand repeat protein [Planctomycetes bacterium]|nr:DUF4097 family beta strand repeat protein [Planctomycetota bacterium]
MRSTSLTVLAALSALAACNLPLHRVSEDRPVRIEAGELRTMHCATHNGSIAIRGGSGTTVEGVATLSAYGNTEAEARKNLARLELVTEIAGGELRLAVEVPDDVDGDVSFDLSAPARLMMLANTHNGSVTVSDASAGLRAGTHNGAVSIEQVATPVSLTTHNGAVRGSILGTELEVDVRTHNGAIALSIAREASARVSAATHNGSIVLSGASEVALAEGSATGTYGDGRGRLTLATHNGGITVRVP